MKTFRLHSHYSSANRYLGRSSGFKRSSVSSASKYKLMSSKYSSLYDETKNDLEESGITDFASLTKTAGRRKASEFTAKGSKYNAGMDSISGSIDDFAELLKKDELDYDKAYDAAEEFVKGYNDVYSAIKNSAGSSIAKKASFFTDKVRTFSNALAEVGVSVNEKDGTLSIDKETFGKASVRDIRNVFGAKSSFATLIEEEADSVGTTAAVTASKSANLYDSTFGARTTPTSAFSGAFFNKKY